jgi:outer membrane lipoprotein-sorting protein
LRTINSVSIEFHQTDLNGTDADGKLLVSKPFKFRCNYYPPFPIVVIGNINYVSIYDYDMESTSYINREENIFNFLTTHDVDFEKHFTIQAATEEDDLLIIVLYHDKSDRTSQISFNKKKNSLDTIKIYEDDNIITLSFGKTRQVSHFEDSLFEFKNPEIFGTPNRLSKTQLEQLIIYKD